MRPVPITILVVAAFGFVAAQTADENLRSYTELRRAVDEDYSYRDLHQVDWEQRFERFRPGLQKATTPQEFASRAATLLAVARDPHIWLTAGDRVHPTFDRDVEPNVSMDLLQLAVPAWREHGACVVTGQTDVGVVFIMIKSWSRSCAGDLDAAYRTLRRNANGKGVILDVRLNTGGDESLAAEFAGCFVREPLVYATHRDRNAAEPDGFAEPVERMLVPNPDQPHYARPVVVLTGQAVMSSAESFLLMMQQAPHVTLVGETSFGSSGNPRPHRLSNGVTVFLPSWKDFRPDGKLLEGRGVKPDVRIKTSAADFRQDDPVLEAARKRLR